MEQPRGISPPSRFSARREHGSIGMADQILPRLKVALEKTGQGWRPDSAKSGCGFVPISSSHSLRSYSLPRIFTYLTIELYLKLGFSLFPSSLSYCQCCNSVAIFVFKPNASCHTDHTLREISTWQKISLARPRLLAVGLACCTTWTQWMNSLLDRVNGIFPPITREWKDSCSPIG